MRGGCKNRKGEQGLRVQAATVYMWTQIRDINVALNFV